MSDIPAQIFVLLLILPVAALFYLSRNMRRIEGQRDEALREVKALKKKLSAAKLDYIETKLNPHLFKNILNSVQSHAYHTFFALDKLSGVLDYVLYESSERYVTPEQEIGFTKNLIEINKIKMNPLFDFRFKIQADENEGIYREKVLAPLITVDFIENAFKHTNFLADDSFISVLITLRAGVLELKVQNRISEKPPMEKDHSGFGAESLEQRLKMIYKKNFTIRKSVHDNLFTAYLKIDLNDRYNQVRYTR